MTSDIEFILISLAVGIVIVGVPLLIYLINSVSTRQEGTNVATAGETTPLRSKHKDNVTSDDYEDDDNASYDSNIVINRILSGGIILHTTKGPKKVTMQIEGIELRWHSSVSGKKYMIELSDVKYVESGKKTHNFRKQASSNARDSNCFSLVCQATTVDLEVNSVSDRDVLVDNFHNVIERIIADRHENDV